MECYLLGAPEWRMRRKKRRVFGMPALRQTAHVQRVVAMLVCCAALSACLEAPDTLEMPRRGVEHPDMHCRA